MQGCATFGNQVKLFVCDITQLVSGLSPAHSKQDHSLACKICWGGYVRTHPSTPPPRPLRTGMYPFHWVIILFYF